MGDWQAVCSSDLFFFKQKTAYEIGTGDWSSDVCSSDLVALIPVDHLTHVVRRDYVINLPLHHVMNGSVTIALLRDPVRFEQKSSVWIVMSPCARNVCRYVMTQSA